MKSKIFIAGILTLTFAAGIPVFAQVTAGERTPAQAKAEKAKKRQQQTIGVVDAYAKKLTLSADQTAKVQTVVLNYRTGVKQIMLDSALKPEEKQAKVDQLRTKADLEIKTILTPEQADKAQKEDLNKPLLAPGPMNPNADELAAYLKLTPDQKQKIQAIFSEQKTKQKEISRNTSLTPEAKKQQFGDLKTATIEKINAVLTPEQKTQYDELIKPKKVKAEGKAKGKHKGQGKKANKAEEPAAATAPAN